MARCRNFAGNFLANSRQKKSRAWRDNAGAAQPWRRYTCPSRITRRYVEAMAVEASAHRSSLTIKSILNDNHLHLKGAADKFRSTSKRSRVCHDGFHLFDQDIAAGSGHT